MKKLVKEKKNLLKKLEIIDQQIDKKLGFGAGGVDPPVLVLNPAGEQPPTEPEPEPNPGPIIRLWRIICR